ncbi:MAG: hypothetical protein US89_C0002G0027 [Candidatus Peregrinibacteria bacterium GW2011_GWF2_38_29]|nr:MAG: hypothetical protein US89_C0002G0027 [Candidatus Peregrinibacteria bacterium GW2011_GWF2_38_29]HBB02183.1 hypothetical protein [Candidatus Peregrinibacteria bacterium]
MKKTMLGLGVLVSALSLVGLSTGVVFAYQGNPSVQGPNYTAERHEAMTQAFEKGDYSAWKNLMQGRGRVTQVVNEGNFTKFAEAHKLAVQGKTVEAQKIRQELGLGLQNGSGKAAGKMGSGRGLNR